jgi:hypothetical protein
MVLGREVGWNVVVAFLADDRGRFRRRRDSSGTTVQELTNEFKQQHHDGAGSGGSADHSDEFVDAPMPPMIGNLI